MQPGPMMMNPMCGYGGMNPGSMNPGFQPQNLMGGWSGVYNNMNNANQPQPQDKMNVQIEKMEQMHITKDNEDPNHDKKFEKEIQCKNKFSIFDKINKNFNFFILI